MIAHYLPAFMILISLSSVAGLILYLVDKYLAHYGRCRMEIRNAPDRSCIVDGGVSLLSCLNDMELYLPSSCGGKGTCGFCKLTVHKGGEAILPLEKIYLSRREIHANVRLACQVKIRGDISVTIPDELLSVKKYETRVIDIKDIARDLKQVTLDLQNSQTISFKAGQYIQLLVPGTDQLRSYSITSNPKYSRRIELLIKHLPGGLCSGFVHNELKKGDLLTILGPYGDFCADRYLNRQHITDMVFIAGGCGIAPVRSILNDLWDKRTQNTIYFFFGARRVDELYFADEYIRRNNTDEQFHFVPAVSEKHHHDNWTGRTGLIHDIIASYPFVPVKTVFFICGPDAMIQSVSEVLITQGHPQHQIHFDSFYSGI
ncbi:MAG: FAD-binding oxidoreductase [Candidatus Auribacterota bacterium]|jgi:Na+-transporting NADH:ubiquinone oxidoreductase subunit F|nr:FAD-binding oxidoreductase [Candidatus Auribacterota bacterium]